MKDISGLKSSALLALAETHNVVIAIIGYEYLSQIVEISKQSIRRYLANQPLRQRTEQ